MWVYLKQDSFLLSIFQSLPTKIKYFSASLWRMEEGAHVSQDVRLVHSTQPLHIYQVIKAFMYENSFFLFWRNIVAFVHLCYILLQRILWQLRIWKISKNKNFFSPIFKSSSMVPFLTPIPLFIFLLNLKRSVGSL